MSSFQRSLAGVALLGFALAWSPAGFAQGKGDKPPAGADPKKIEEAKKHMAAGAALYNDPSGRKCEEAYVEFNKAYELSGGSLNALKNRAACALELEKDGEALEDYKKVLEGMGQSLDRGERAQIESDVKALEAAVAWVTIKLDVPRAQLVDVRTTSRGMSIKNRYELTTNSTKLGFHPGEHVFTAATDDGKERVWKVILSNGSTQEHTFELTKIETAPTAPTAVPSVEPKMERPVPLSVKVLAGVTGAFAVGTGVMMGLAGVARTDYENINGKSTDKSEIDSKHGNVILMNGIADGLLGGTVLAAGTTLVLFLLRPSVKVETTKTSGAFIAPAVTPAAGGVVIGGHF